MIHNFELIYELDCTVGEAVLAYLDAEHYIHLHKDYTSQYRVIKKDGMRIYIEQTWKRAFVTIGNICTTQYNPPSTFLNYDLKPMPRWVPSIHHLIKTRTELKYYPSANKDKTISHLKVQLDFPVTLWFLRKLIQERLKRLKILKDQEDIDMITRQQKIFGRGNLSHILRKNIFILHKEEFIKSFDLKTGHLRPDK